MYSKKRAIYVVIRYFVGISTIFRAHLTFFADTEAKPESADYFSSLQGLSFIIDSHLKSP